MANRIEIKVTVNGIYSYEAPCYGAYWRNETHYIYNMQGEDGTVFVWKTTKFLCEQNSQVNKGDILTITASVKGQSEYKGQPQTEIQRVKVVSRDFKAKTWKEIQAECEAKKELEKKAQLESIKDDDFIWRMSYKQYKEHYSDCETVINSFKRDIHNGATIEVVIRVGRLKASGVRGKHYHTYKLINENGKCVMYKAISEENALKRASKHFPEHTWTLDRIYC